MKTLVLTLCVLTMGHFSSFAVETGPTGPENPLEGGGGGSYTYYCWEAGSTNCIEVTSTQSLPSCYASAAQCCAAGGDGILCGSSNGSNGSNGGTGLNDDSAAFTDDDGATNIITATDTSPSNNSTLLKFRCKNDAPDAEPHIHYLDAPDKPLHFCNQGNRGGFKSWVVQNYEGIPDIPEAVDTLDRDGGDITGPPTDTNGGSTTGTNGGSTTGSSGTGSGDGGSGNTQTFE